MVFKWTSLDSAQNCHFAQPFVSLQTAPSFPLSWHTLAYCIAPSCEEARLWEDEMGQVNRFFLKPRAFVNQLQWSRNHWGLLGLFLALASLESFLGPQYSLHRAIAWRISQTLHVQLELAIVLWALGRALLVATLAGTVVFALSVVGGFVGRPSSSRVLLRRLAVVFTVILAGSMLERLAFVDPALVTVGWVAIGWGLMLGFLALREQFQVAALRASVLMAFAVFLSCMLWKVSEDSMRQAISKPLVKQHHVQKWRHGRVH